MKPIEACPEGCRLQLWVQPRASRDQVVGLQGEAVKVRLTAPPVEGKANTALIRFLAKKLGVGRGELELCSGETGRRKTLRVTGLDPDQVRRRLGLC